uniref:Uncharacterized protein n=1 Tax=Plectus sambesii TaxID=2011161 RepID=A0A914VBH6_9BILA
MAVSVKVLFVLAAAVCLVCQRAGAEQLDDEEAGGISKRMAESFLRSQMRSLWKNHPEKNAYRNNHVMKLFPLKKRSVLE